MEVGVRARTAALAYSAALFDSRTRDEVVVVANEGGRSVYDNAGTTRRRGAELSVSGEISPSRSEEHTSELQSLMRISSAVFCLKKKTNRSDKTNTWNVQ